MFKNTVGDNIGLYILLNSTLIGPYRRLSTDYYFTDDSKYLIYTHDGIEEKYELK